MEKQELLSQIDDCKVKLDRALRLTGSLGKERGRWVESAIELKEDKIKLLDDTILASIYISYLGPFPGVYRDRIMDQKWDPQEEDDNQEENEGEDESDSYKFSLSKSVGDQLKIKSWVMDGLPDDRASIENVLIMNEMMSQKYSLMIDPQRQTINFLMGHLEDVEILKFDSPSYSKVLESCIAMGKPVIFENITEDIDPAVMPLVGRDFFEKAGSLYVKMNDVNTEVHKDFKLYLCTEMANPHFTPDLQSKICLLNFAIKE